MDSELRRLQEALDNEISIVPFKFNHLPMLYDMLRTQEYLDVSHISMKTLPKIGYIALMNKQPIAAGFLRRVEGGFAQLDGLTSNAYFGSKVRHEGIRKVVDTLIDEAKTMKLHGVIGITKDDGVLTRAKSLGFQVVEQTLISLKF